MLARGIVRSLLVLSTFVLGGGGGSVAIGRYCLFVWATVVGIGVLCVCVSRSPGNHALLWVIRARQVASHAVTRGVWQSLWCSRRGQTYCVLEIKLLLCESSGEYSNTVISCSIVTGINIVLF